MLRPLLNLSYAFMVGLVGQEKTDEMFSPDTPEVPEEQPENGRRRRKLSAAEIQARREFMRGFA